MSRKYFGTDGVRGPYGGALVNEDFFARLTMAAVAWSARQAGSVANRRVLVGRDTRASGASLAQAVLNAIAAAGGEAVSLGVLPTPAVARAVKTTGAALGVVITASHNPAADNGIKFFGLGGQKLTDAEEEAIESLLSAHGSVNQPAVVTETNAVEDYIRAAAQLLPAGALAGWKIVIDTANGATCATSPEVLRRLGAEVIGIGLHPDGVNINAGVGSEHPEKLVAKVTATGARLGIAHDGDGDRCILCDEQGAVLDGDEILTMLAVDALKRGALAQHTLVVTIQSNLGVDAAVKAAGGRVFRTNVGDRYVIERMRCEGALLGGESSGHIVCADVSPTGDGLIAALMVLAVMLRTGEPLSILRRLLRKFPQVTQALKVREKRDLSLCPSLTAAIQELESRLGEAGRVLVRYSGTEDKLRLLVEAASDAEAAQGLAALEAAAKHDLAVL
ncbi:MAG: phosphoglucosamine mutase [Opitutaceae bacterium]